MRLFLAPFLIGMLALPGTLFAEPAPPKKCQVMYKYTDDQNITIISSTLPPEAARKSYIILNGQGREKETVTPTPQPSAPSASQGRVDNATLLKMYDNVNDIKQSKKEQIDALENIERVTLDTIKHIQEQIEVVKKTIAQYENSHQPIPPFLKERILKHQQSILENQAFLKRKQAEKRHTEAEYDTLIKNFETLKPAQQPILGVSQ